MNKAEKIAVLVEVARRAMHDSNADHPVDLAAVADAAMLGAAHALDVISGRGDVRLPHRFPATADGEVIAWVCQACGETVSEFGDRAACSVDWRADA